MIKRFLDNPPINETTAVIGSFDNGRHSGQIKAGITTVPKEGVMITTFGKKK